MMVRASQVGSATEGSQPMIDRREYDRIRRAASPLQLDLIEFFNETIEKIQDQIANEHRFKPVTHSLRIFGLCWECQVAAEADARRHR